MTILLACIRDADEAAAALAAGFDGVMVDRPQSRSAVLALVEQHPVPARVAWLEDGAMVIVASGERFRLAVRTAPWPDDAVQSVQAAGEAGLLVRSGGRLLDAASLPPLAALADTCRSRGLMLALAGAIEAPDVPRLLAREPTMLLVGRALRRDDQSPAPLDPARVASFRALVPSEGKAPPPRRVVTPRPDRIFVHDLVMSLDIGAYQSEHGRLQRVRFSVEAALAQGGGPSLSMADVVSYDLIVDAIHGLTKNRRVALVETLAEAIAEELLMVPRIVEVRVRVEKLDLGAGAVGVEIVRAAYDAA